MINIVVGRITRSVRPARSRFSYSPEYSMVIPGGNVGTISRSEPVAAHCGPTHFGLQIGLALNPRGSLPDGAEDLPDAMHDLECRLLKSVEIVAQDFQSQLGANAGADHQYAVLDRLEESRNV